MEYVCKEGISVASGMHCGGRRQLVKNMRQQRAEQLVGGEVPPKTGTAAFVIYRRVPFVQPVYRYTRAFVSKRVLKKRIARRMALSDPCRIVIGANKKPRGDWILTEIYNLNILKENDWRRYFTEGTIDALLAEHVWEHLTPDEGKTAAQLCLRYLKPGGYIRVAVPDGLFPSADYIDFVRPGGVGPSADDHKILYTYKTLSTVFELAGLEVELLEYWDEHGKLHSSDWDPEDGMIMRSRRFAKHAFRCHNGEEHNYTSIILDARKP